MKKSRIILLAVLVVFLVVTVSITGYRNNVISEAKTGYLVYVDNNINVIDLETTTKTEYNVDGYSNLRCIGNYYGGDFCCLAFNNETKDQEILLFKNGTVEKSYSVSKKIICISAYNDKVYYLAEESRNKGSLNCIYKDETELIANDVEEFAINSIGEIVYIIEKPDNDNQSSVEDDINGELYYLADNKTIKLGEACGVDAWLSNDELLITTEKVDITYRENGEVASAGHTFEEYIVYVENNEWTYSKEFNKVPHVVDISPDNNKAITFITSEGFDIPYYGIYHIEKDIFMKKAIYDGVNNEDVFEEMGSNTLWLNENPME